MKREANSKGEARVEGYGQSPYDSTFTDVILFGTRTCPTCGVTKPRNSENFHHDADDEDGLHRECRECRVRRQREIGRQDNAVRAARSRARYASDPEYREKKKAAAHRTARRPAEGW